MEFKFCKHAFWVYIGNRFRVEIGWFKDEPFALLLIEICEWTPDINWFTFVGLQIAKFHIQVALG